MVRIQSGDIRYDRFSNEQVRLVSRVKINGGKGDSTWIVLYPDMTLKMVDMSSTAKIRKLTRKARSENPTLLRSVSQVEWNQLKTVGLRPWQRRLDPRCLAQILQG